MESKTRGLELLNVSSATKHKGSKRKFQGDFSIEPEIKRMRPDHNGDVLTQMPQYYSNVDWGKLKWKRTMFQDGPNRGSVRWTLWLNNQEDDAKDTKDTKESAQVCDTDNKGEIARFITPWHKFAYAKPCDHNGPVGYNLDEVVVAGCLDFTRDWIQRLCRHWKDSPKLDRKDELPSMVSEPLVEYYAAGHVNHYLTRSDKYRKTIDHMYDLNYYEIFKKANAKSKALLLFSHNHVNMNKETTCGHLTHERPYRTSIHDDRVLAHPIDYPVMNTNGNVLQTVTVPDPSKLNGIGLINMNWPSPVDDELENKSVAHTFVVYMSEIHIPSTHVVHYRIRFQRISTFAQPSPTSGSIIPSSLKTSDKEQCKTTLTPRLENTVPVPLVFTSRLWSSAKFIDLISTMLCVPDLLSLRCVSEQCKQSADKHILLPFRRATSGSPIVRLYLHTLTETDAVWSGSGPFDLLSRGASFRKEEWKPNDMDIFVPCNGLDSHLDWFVQLLKSHKQLLDDEICQHLSEERKKEIIAAKLNFNPKHCKCEHWPCDNCMETKDFQIRPEVYQNIVKGMFPDWTQAEIDAHMLCDIRELESKCRCGKRCQNCQEADGYDSMGGRNRGYINNMNIICVHPKPGQPFWKTVVESFNHTIVQNVYDFKTKTLHMNYPEHVRMGISHYSELPNERGLVTMCKYRQRGVTMLPNEFVTMRKLLLQGKT